MSKYRVVYKCASENFGNMQYEFAGEYDDAFRFVRNHFEFVNDYDEPSTSLWMIYEWSETLEEWIKVAQLSFFKHV